MAVVRRSTPELTWEIATAAPHPALRGRFGEYCGYAETSRPAVRREVPHAAVTLILNLGEPLRVDGRPFASFVAGLHDRAV